MNATESKILVRLRAELGPIPASDVEFLRERGYLNVEIEEDFVPLVDTARYLLSLRQTSKNGSSPQRRRLARRHPTLWRPRLSVKEQARWDARSEWDYNDATMYPPVGRFRDDVVGGQLLTETETIRFLSSPAVQRFSLARFQEVGLVPAQVDSELISEDLDPDRKYDASVRVNGATWTFTDDLNRPVPSWGRRRNNGSFELGLRASMRGAEAPTFWHGSVLFDLWLLSMRLMQRGYNWLPLTASWFILTGVAEPVPPLRRSATIIAGTTSRSTIVEIHAEPWISVDSVSRAYRDSQFIYLKRRNRSLSDRRLALFRFVTAERAGSTESLSWRDLMPRWNRSHPKWKYENVRNLSRDYWAAARLLLIPQRESLDHG